MSCWELNFCLVRLVGPPTALITLIKCQKLLFTCVTKCRIAVMWATECFKAIFQTAHTLKYKIQLETLIKNETIVAATVLSRKTF